MDAPVIAPGQSWAIRDDRYAGWRYVTVETIEPDGRALVRPRSRNGRRSRIPVRHFRRSRFSFCGHDGPGDLPPLGGAVYGGCLNCGPRPPVLPLAYELEPGFGATTVTRNGEPVWRTCRDTRKRLAHLECWARELGGDWRIRLTGPLSESLYQRKPEGWVLVWHGFGFA